MWSPLWTSGLCPVLTHLYVTKANFGFSSKGHFQCLCTRRFGSQPFFPPFFTRLYKLRTLHLSVCLMYLLNALSGFLCSRQTVRFWRYNSIGISFKSVLYCLATNSFQPAASLKEQFFLSNDVVAVVRVVISRHFFSRICTVRYD